MSDDQLMILTAKALGWTDVRKSTSMFFGTRPGYPDSHPVDKNGVRAARGSVELPDFFSLHTAWDLLIRSNEFFADHQRPKFLKALTQGASAEELAKEICFEFVQWVEDWVGTELAPLGTM